MKTYKVRIEERLAKVVEVQAESEKEALEQTKHDYFLCKIVLDANNFSGFDMEVER